LTTVRSFTEHTAEMLVSQPHQSVRSAFSHRWGSQSIAMHKIRVHVECALYPNARYIGAHYNGARQYIMSNVTRHWWKRHT